MQYFHDLYMYAIRFAFAMIKYVRTIDKDFTKNIFIFH